MFESTIRPSISNELAGVTSYFSSRGVGPAARSVSGQFASEPLPRAGRRSVDVLVCGRMQSPAQRCRSFSRASSGRRMSFSWLLIQ
jgi:hypothetical protein